MSSLSSSSSSGRSSGGGSCSSSMIVWRIIGVEGILIVPYLTSFFESGVESS